MKKGYIAHNLTESAREMLLKAFPPVFSKVVAHHITVAFGVSDSTPMPYKADIKVIGYARNEKIECVVVSVNGSSKRDDGKIFHITLSHSDEAKPVQSNDLIQEKGFEPVPELSLESIPTFNSF